MNGILFIATGQKHLDEARLCIRSIRALSDLPITLLTDRAVDLPATVQRVEQASFSWDDKPRWIAKLPYDRTMFLDTDTVVLRRDALEVFDLLDRFALALAHAPVRSSLAMNDVPACFPEFNSGVILLRKSEAVREALSRWQQTHSELKQHAKRGRRLGDQAALRRVLYESDLRIATLTPEYNFRGFANARISQSKNIRILHNRKIQPHALSPDGSINWCQIQSWFAKR